MSHDTVTLIVLIASLGMAVQWLAWRFSIPAIILLMFAGFFLGPWMGWVNPSEQLGPLLEPLLGLSVAVILFDGGLNLKFQEFQQAGDAVKRLVTTGMSASWLLAGATAFFIGGLSWPVALLFGAITVVTGPTVIMPLLRQARLSRRVGSSLKWEGIINDPVGALLAVLVLEYFLYAKPGEAWSQVFWGLASALSAAVLLGVGSGFLLGTAFHRGYVPEFLKAPTVIAMVLVVYEVANWAQNEAGLLAATLLGIMLGNLRLRSIAELRRFLEFLSIIFVSAVFIILTADLKPEILGRLNWNSAALLALIILAVRPVSVFLSTVGIDMTWRERLLLGWIAPRGIVAVAVAGVSASQMIREGHEDAQLLVPLVLSLVFLTITLHGATIGWFARKLRLASKHHSGVLIVGSSPWTIEFARQLVDMKIPVVMTDTSWDHLVPARLAGIPVYYGEVLSEERERTLEMNDIGYLLAATSNDAYNALACSHFAPTFGRHRVFQLPMHTIQEDDPKALSDTVRGLMAFEEGAKFEELLYRHYRNWKFQKTRLTQEFSYRDYLNQFPKDGILLLLSREDGTVQFHSREFPIEPKVNDTILSYVPA